MAGIASTKARYEQNGPEARIRGSEPWERDYPFDSPTMIAIMRSAPPHVDCDQLDMHVSAESQAHLLGRQS